MVEEDKPLESTEGKPEEPEKTAEEKAKELEEGQ